MRRYSQGISTGMVDKLAVDVADKRVAYPGHCLLMAQAVAAAGSGGAVLLTETTFKQVRSV